MKSLDDWSSPAAFDDVESIEPKLNDKAAQWGLYRPTKSSIHHGKGYCSFHLYLVDTETGEQVELFFNNVRKSASGLYSVKRGSDFAKLYQDCFGETNPRKFSKAHQLLKHFHTKSCLLLCRTTYSTRKDGKVYSKVIEQKNGNQLETERKLTGNLLETYWKPQSLDTPVNTWSGGLYRVIDKYLIENREIEQYNSPSSNQSNTKYKVKNESGGFDFIKMPMETLDKLYDRVLDETWK